MFDRIRQARDAWVAHALGVLVPSSSSSEVEESLGQPQQSTAAPREAPSSDLPMPPSSGRPPQLEHAVRAKLMTFDELKGKIGRSPSPDRFFGLKKMSSRYKEVERTLGGAQEAINAILAQPLSVVLDDERDLTDFLGKLDNLISAARTYQMKYDEHKQNVQYEALEEIIQNAIQYKKNVSIVLSDLNCQDVKYYLTLGQAIQIKEYGIRFCDCDFQRYNDNNVKSKSNPLTGGKFNKPYFVTYKNNETRVFKPELDDTSNSKTSNDIGIDSDNPHLANRNIASCIVSNVIGVNVIADAKVCLDNGVVGLSMEKASGVRVDSLNNVHKEQKDDILTKPELVAGLHAGLNALEWCDALTGQADRHHENYFVYNDNNKKIKITAIDNDMAFGKNTNEIPFVDKNKKTNNGFMIINGNWVPCKAYPYHWIGQPALIDKKIYDRIINLNFDNDVRPQLQGLLTDEEITATAARFAHAQTLARELAQRGCVIEDWQTWRWQNDDGTSLNASQYLSQANTKSFFARDFT